MDTISYRNALLVNCGDTFHIITDKSKFSSFDIPENHHIELSDASRTNNIALKRGNVQVILTDILGNMPNFVLKCAFYILTFKQ